MTTAGTDASNDCSNPGNPCATIQHAIDQANSSDHIRVAGGTYTRVGTVAVITQDTTILGAYDPGFNGPDPDMYETILDAQWGGSVISITNAGDVVLIFLTVTRGDGAGNCGSWGCGGGVYSKDTNLHMAKCTVEDNVGNSGGQGKGGGIYAYNSDIEIRESQIVSNTANANASSTGASGGGIHVIYGTALLRENHILDNLGHPWRAGFGGGIYLHDVISADVLTNTIQDNKANGTGSPWGSYGGGLYVSYSSDVVIAGNRIEGNSCNGNGGGIMVDHNDAHLARNTVILNTAAAGGGIYITSLTPNTLTNNLIAHNSASFRGGGVEVEESDPPGSKALLVNNTIVDNGDSGILGWEYALITVTNNVIAGHTEGITTPLPFTGVISADHNLFWNASDPITGTNAILANPLLTPHYHLYDGSPALNEGLTIAWLTTDLDGKPRPQDSDYDIGAYEGAWWDVRLPLVMRKY